jgi:hypothetical protein
MKPLRLACAGLVARDEEKNAYWSLVGKRERKKDRSWTTVIDGRIM